MFGREEEKYTLIILSLFLNDDLNYVNLQSFEPQDTETVVAIKTKNKQEKVIRKDEV